MSASKSKKNNELEEEILTQLSNGRLHHTLILPSTAAHGELRVTYSVVGAGADELPLNPTPAGTRDSKIPTIIWVGPMMGGRWQGHYAQHLAEKEGVRLVYIDRPGAGGSSPVPLSQRITVWLETVQHVMSILGVKHVVLASHSAGTVYLMNTIYRLRDILPPKRPYVAFFAPWVHPEHSSQTLLSSASYLPSSLVSHFGGVNQFIARNIIPSVAASSGALSTISSILPGKSTPTQEQAEAEKKQDEVYGMGKEARDLTDELIFNLMFSESPDAVGQEALFCLRMKTKDNGGVPLSWEAAENFETYVKELADRERHRLSSENSSGQDPVEKFKVDVFFGETDFMIGKKGDKYFRDCWAREEYKDAIDYEGRTIKGSNHDTAPECWRGGFETVIAEAKKSLT